MAKKPTIKPITARRRLELSRVGAPALQRELMGTDVDVKSFSVYLGGLVKTDLAGRIVDATVSRTIEAASTLTVEINDHDRAMFNSYLLTERFDVKVDGLWFRLTGIEKQGDSLTLTFQDREVEILRTYHKWYVVQRGKMTRAEFVLSLIREVKEFNIPVVIPQLHKIQPIAAYSGDLQGTDMILEKAQGVPNDFNDNEDPKDAYNHRDGTTSGTSRSNKLTVQNATATREQINNANVIMAVCNAMGVSRRLKVCALMTAIQESWIKAIPDKAHGGNSDADSAGIYQQRPGWGSYDDRMDPETSTRLFLNAAIPVEKTAGDQPYWTICYRVQNCREDLRALYSKWRTEAERFVNASGDVTDVNAANNQNGSVSAYGTTQGTYYFYRGEVLDKRGQKIRKPENSWKCIQRLADEVDWRAFFVSGTFYFITEDDLFKQIPVARISEFSPGVLSLDGNFDNHAKSANVTLNVEIGRWMAPPGSVIILYNCGVFDGRWIVSDYSRSLVSSDRVATVILKKPRPKLPEPDKQGNATDINPGWAPVVPSEVAPTPASADAVLNNKKIVFQNVCQRSDIQFGRIDERLLTFLQWITKDRGYDIIVTALKCDHDLHTSGGNISAHSAGKAVDIGSLSGVRVADNEITGRVMDMLAHYQTELQFDQLIGPFPSKVIPYGYYDGSTLAQHDNHIHVGWKM